MKNLAASAVLGLVAVPPAAHTCITVRDRGWSRDGDSIPYSRREPARARSPYWCFSSWLRAQRPPRRFAPPCPFAEQKALTDGPARGLGSVARTANSLQRNEPSGRSARCMRGSRIMAIMARRSHATLPSSLAEGRPSLGLAMGQGTMDGSGGGAARTAQAPDKAIPVKNAVSRRDSAPGRR